MSPEAPVRVLIADDSPTARALLAGILGDDARFTVVGEAADGLEAVQLARRLTPDVILMDIHMPGLDGVEATRRIMDEVPTPIVLVTGSSNHADTKVTLNALDAGALAVLHKPLGPASPDFAGESQRIVATVLAMAGILVMRRHVKEIEGSEQLEAALALRREPVRIAAIAASTGGPTAIRRILSELPVPFKVPVLVVQHIVEGFGPGLAEWLAEGTHLAVKIAVDKEVPADGMVYLSPDNRHLGVSPDRRLALSDAPPVAGYRPSASFLFESLARAYGPGTLSVILTGMGEDGVAGLRMVKRAGGLVLAQDEHSCVVFGMPGQAIAAGLVDAVIPLDGMGVQIGRSVRHG